MRKLFAILVSTVIATTVFAQQQNWTTVVGVDVYSKPTAAWTDGADFCLNGSSTTIVLTLTGKPAASSPYWSATTAPTLSNIVLPDFTVNAAGTAGANWMLAIAGAGSCLETWTYTYTVPNDVAQIVSASGGTFSGSGTCVSETATGSASITVNPKPTVTLSASPSVCQFSDSTNFGVTMTLTGNPVSCGNWTMTLNGTAYTLPVNGNETWVLTSANAGATCTPPAQNVYTYFNRITTAFAADSIYTITSLTDCYACPNTGLNITATASIYSAPSIEIITETICEDGSIPVNITTFAALPAPTASIVCHTPCADLSCEEGSHPVPSAHTWIAANPTGIISTGGSAGAYTWSGSIAPVGPGTWIYHVNSVAQGTCVSSNETLQQPETPTCVPN
ncbi:hypothetical protein FACS1894178_8710 [Bacteroidia bacterium]|nr:hypothetical protein FACS1894178_8710 [Bacteroidia bacterium]